MTMNILMSKMVVTKIGIVSHPFGYNDDIQAFIVFKNYMITYMYKGTILLLTTD